jgi:hypothetical protein
MDFAKQVPSAMKLSEQIDEIKDKLSDGEYLNIMNTMGDLYKEIKKVQPKKELISQEDIQNNPGYMDFLLERVVDIRQQVLNLPQLHVDVEFEHEEDDQEDDDQEDQDDDDQEDQDDDDQEDQDDEGQEDQDDDQDDDDQEDQDDDQDDDEDDSDDSEDASWIDGGGLGWEEEEILLEESMKVNIGGIEYYKRNVGEIEDVLFNYPDGDEVVGTVNPEDANDVLFASLESSLIEVQQAGAPHNQPLHVELM